MLFKVNGPFPHSPVHTLLCTHEVADFTCTIQNGEVTHLCSFWVSSMVPVSIFHYWLFFSSDASAQFSIILHEDVMFNSRHAFFVVNQENFLEYLWMAD